MQLFNRNKIKKQCIVLVASTILLSGLPCLAQDATPAAPPATPAVPPPPQIIDAATYTGSSLSVGAGQTVILDFGSQSSLQLTGDILNAGLLYAISTNPLVNTASFSANNITNQQGAVFSSVLPSGMFSNINPTVGQLSLVLTAVQNIVNAGSIMSSGSLSLNAGGTIVNALPAGMSGPSPIMQAMSAVNLAALSGNITNAGLISSVSNNVNINTQLMQNLVLNNAAGRLEALTGQINIGNILASNIQNNLTVLGGDLLSNELNLLSGPYSLISAHVNSITGGVNVSGGDLNIGTVVGGLNINSLNLSGDPIIYSQADGVALNLAGFSSLFTTNGSDFIVLSGGDVNYNGAASTINATSPSANGGKISINAGVTFTAPALPNPAPCTTCNFTITGESNSGGNISLSGLSLVTNNNSVSLTSSKGLSGLSNANISIGSITTSGRAAAVNSGAAGAAGGSVSIISQGTLTTGAIITSGGAGANAINGGAGGAGGAGGSLTLNTNGAVLTGLITTNGGTAGNGANGVNRGDAGGAGGIGGTAGALNLTLGSTANLGAITAIGGSGGTAGAGRTGEDIFGNRNGGAGGAGGHAGNSGQVDILASDNLSITSIDVSGATGGAGGAGGAGGIGGPGGNGGTGGVGGYGGSGGALNFLGAAYTIGAINGNGGKAGSGGNGGDGGLTNGDGGLGGVGGFGGSGSQITSATQSLSTGNIQVNGGNGGASGNGGMGRNSPLLFNGGIGANGANGAQGGNGGYLNLTSNTSIQIASIAASGGSGGNGGSGGTGGSLLVGAVGVHAGVGGNGGDGGQGGNSGRVDLIAATFNSGAATFIAGNGGIGGASGEGGDVDTGANALTDAGNAGHGGKGGAGGSSTPITITVSGATNLTGALQVHAGSGGNGGIGAAGGDVISYVQVKNKTGNGGDGGAGGAAGNTNTVTLQSGTLKSTGNISLLGGNGGTGAQAGHGGNTVNSTSILGDAGNGGNGGAGGVGGSTGILTLGSTGTMDLLGLSSAGGIGGTGGGGRVGGTGAAAAGHGGTGGAGSAAGSSGDMNISVSNGNLIINGPLLTRGGNGGTGAGGGTGGSIFLALFSSAGDGGAGGAGGRGGNTGLINLSTPGGTISTKGGITVIAGNGGGSGSGGNGGHAIGSVPGAGNGANAGIAGAGGNNASATAINAQASGSIDLSSILISGGNGGYGEVGGDGGTAISQSGFGGDGGAAGSGGSTGGVTAKSSASSVTIASINLLGGNGGNGGNGGFNSTATAVQHAGSGGVAGAGGATGDIQLQAASSLTINGALSSTGGGGGGGGIGGNGQSDTKQSPSGAGGGNAGTGGEGGNAGSLSAQAGTMLTLNQVSLLGGTGGAAGSAGNGGSGIAGGAGGNGGKGGKGGSTGALILSGDQSLKILSTLIMSGGNGGLSSRGGNGGGAVNPNLQGAAAGGDGGDGGNTGNLTINSSSGTINTSNISMLGGRSADGAAAGSGGNGLVGGAGAKGGAGGHGGGTGTATIAAAGAITLGLLNSTASSGSLGATAGNGGTGVSSGDGGIGGLGGAGGATGQITINSGATITLNGISSTAGNGSSGGIGGNGGDTTALNGGNGGRGGNSGAGGAAGGITLNAVIGINDVGVLQVVGGNGANGARGGNPHGSVLAQGGRGGTGGDAGAGGSAGSIIANASTGSVFIGSTLQSIGGNGGTGGAGQGGSYGSAVGGNGGNGGASAIGANSGSINIIAGTSISANAGISSIGGTGGNGASGGNGGGSLITAVGAGTASSASKGGDAGNISLTSGTAIQAGELKSFGGAGGNGGLGGHGGEAPSGGGGGAGGSGANGGNAGAISITAGSSYSSLFVSSLGGVGGIGGGGGTGAFSGGSAAQGTIGGHGGNAGAVGIFAGTQLTVSGGVRSIGGNGGTGGFGGGGGNAPGTGSPGASGGRGGDAGTGSSISLLAGGDITITGNLLNSAGNGGQGGSGGNGGSAYGNPGDGGNGGGGGNGLIPGGSGAPGAGACCNFIGRYAPDGNLGPIGIQSNGTADLVAEGRAITIGGSVFGSSVSLITGAGSGALTLVKPRLANTNTGAYNANSLIVQGGITQTNPVTIAQNFTNTLNLSNISSNGGSVNVPGLNNLFASSATYATGQDFVALSSGNILASSAPAGATIGSNGAHIIFGSGQSSSSLQAKTIVIGVTRSNTGGNISLTAPASANTVHLGTSGGLIFLDALSGNTNAGSISAGILTTRAINSPGLVAISSNSNLNLTGLVTTGYALLNSASGNIGSSGSPVLLSTPHLSVTAKGGSAEIQNNAALAGIFNSFTSQNFNYTDTTPGANTYVGGGLSYTSNFGILSGGSISLVSDNITLAVPIKAASTVTLHPFSNNVQIGVTGGAGTFLISPFSLGQITASSVAIGSVLQTGGINLGSYTAPASGAGSFNIILNNAGAFNQAANNVFTVPGLTINAASATFGANASIVTTNNNLAISTIPAGNPLNVVLGSNAKLEAKSGQVTFNATTAGAVTIANAGNGTISASKGIVLNGGANAVNVNVQNLTGAVIANGSSVSIVSAQGQLLTGAITTTAGSTVLTALGGNLTIGGLLNGNGGSMTLNGAGGITVNANISNTLNPTAANSLVLNSSAPSFGILLNANVTSNGDLVLLSNASIARTSGVLNGTSISLTSTNGSVGSGLARSGTNVFVNTPVLQVHGRGAAVTANSSVTLQSASAGNAASFSLSTVNNGNITVNAAPTQATGTTLKLSAGGSGNIVHNTAQTLSASSIELESGIGNVGSLATPILTSSTNLKANTSLNGSVYVAATGDVNIGDSSAGSAFVLSSSGSINSSSDIRSSGSLSLSSDKNLDILYAIALNGSLALTAGLNPALGPAQLHIKPNGIILASQGDLLLNNRNTTNGSTILIDSNSVLTAFSTTNLGQVRVFFGNTFVPSAGSTPGNVTETKIGGLILYGNTTIKANGPTTNNLIAINGLIGFNTDPLSSNAIVLNGGTVIASLSGQAPKVQLRSLDLSDANVVSEIQTLQQNGYVGGKLVYVAGVLTGTAIISPSNLFHDLGNNIQLTAENIVPNVVVSFKGFSNADPINYNLTGLSTTKQFITSGTHTFTGSQATDGIINVNSNQAGPAILINPTGQLTSSGNLTIAANGNISVAGLISAHNLTMSTSNNGSVDISGSINIEKTANIQVDGLGNITQSGNTALLRAEDLSLNANLGNIGTALNAINISASTLSASSINGSVNLIDTGDSSRFAGNTIRLLASGAGPAQSFVLATKNGGSIDIDGNVQAGAISLTVAPFGSITSKNANGTLSASTYSLNASLGSIGDFIFGPAIAIANGAVSFNSAFGTALTSTGDFTVMNSSAGLLGASLTSGGTISIGNAQTLSGQSVLITAAGLTNNGNINSGSSIVVNALTTDLTLSGAGSMSAGGFILPIVSINAQNLNLANGVNQNITSGSVLVNAQNVIGSGNGSATIAVPNGILSFASLSNLRFASSTAQPTTLLLNSPNTIIACATCSFDTGTTIRTSGNLDVFAAGGLITFAGGSALESTGFLGGNRIALSSLGTLTVQTESGTNASLKSAGGQIKISPLFGSLSFSSSGAVAGNLNIVGGLLQASSEPGHDILIGADISSNNQASFTAANAGSILVQGGLSTIPLLTAPSLVLSSGSGNIVVNTSTNQITANTGGTGSVLVSQTGAVAINNSSAGLFFLLSTSGAGDASIRNAGAISAPIVGLQAGGVNSNIVVSAPISAALSLNLAASGSGNITDSPQAFWLNSPSMSLTAPQGNIDLRTIAQTINFTSTGNVALTNIGSNLVVTQGNSNLNSLYLTNDRNLLLTSDVNSSQVGGTAGNITIRAGGSLTLGNLQANGATKAGAIILSAGTNLTASDILANGNNGSVSVTAGFDLTVSNIVSSGGTAGTIALSAGTNLIASNILAQGNNGSIFLTAGLNLTTSNLSSSGSNSGAIFARSGLALSLGDVIANSSSPGSTRGSVVLLSGTNLNAGILNSSGTGGANGASLLALAGGTFTASYADSSSDTGNGGTIILSGAELTFTGNNLSGASVDVSSTAGNGGTAVLFSITHTPFIIGSATGTNRLAGNINASGGLNGGTLGILSAPETSLRNGFSVQANGGTGNGGNIGFASIGNFMKMTIDGLVSATNAADKSGSIYFSTPECTALTLTGTGTVHAGDVVNVGNLVANPITISVQTIGNRVLATPCPTCFPAPPSPTPTVISGRAEFRVDTNFLAKIDQGLNIGLSTRVPTDTLNRDISEVGDANNKNENRAAVSGAFNGGAMLKGEIIFDQATIRDLLTNGLNVANVNEANADSTNNSATSNLSNDSKAKSLVFQKGTLLLAPTNDISVRIGSLDLEIAAGSVVLLIGSGGNIAVLNLHDEHASSVVLSSGVDKLTLPPGREFLITANTRGFSANKIQQIAHRNLQRSQISNQLLYSAEFSLSSAFNNVGLLRTVLSASGPNQALAAKVLKTAAAINTVKPQQSFSAE